MTRARTARARQVGAMVPLALGFALLLTALAGPAGGAAKKGGTLRVDLPDPGHGGPWEALTCRTLLDFSNATPARLVPDAAASAPVVSRDSRTYTFTIRKGLKYFNGKGLTARDFAYAIGFHADARLSSPATVFLRDIASVKALGGPKLRIRLKRAVPDLLARLATPWFCAIPPGTPHSPNASIPGAGPYYVASSTAARVVLKRNRFYAGPKQSNPDEIVFNLGVSLATQRLRCEHDESDVCGFPQDQAAGLREKYGVNQGRFFVKPQTTLWYLALNHDRDLFRDNDKLSRAVNLAVDRPAVLKLNGALGGAATDQILPPGVSGFRDWSIYPLKKPNLRAAKKLAKGNQRDGKCQLWTFDSGIGPGAAQIVQSNLRQIGLECDITTLDRATELAKAGTRGAGFDVALAGWSQDYPDPYDYLNVLLDGTQIHARNNINLSYFNDARVNRQLSAAAAKTGPGRRRAYSTLDRDLMKRSAPLVPLFVEQSGRTLVSSRVGCFTSNQVYGVDYGALCLDQQAARLTVARAGNGAGVVTSDVPGIACGTTCSKDFAYGSTVILTAAPGNGAVFSGWAGVCAGAARLCTVTMNGARSVQAVFKKKRYPLTVAKNGGGTGTVTSNLAGISCGSVCSASYDHGTVVTLTAHPDAHSDFAGWTGACSGTASTCAVTMTASRSVGVTFRKKAYLLSVGASGNGSGAVTSDTGGIACPPSCSATYDDGTTVTLTATPAVDSDFTSWSGPCSSTTGDTCTVAMDAAKSVTALFAKKTYTLSVSKDGTGSGGVTSAPPGIDCGTACSATYEIGTATTLTATPDTGSTFVGWSGGGCSGTGGCSVTLSADTAVTATFNLGASPLFGALCLFAGRSCSTS